MSGRQVSTRTGTCEGFFLGVPVDQSSALGSLPILEMVLRKGVKAVLTVVERQYELSKVLGSFLSGRSWTFTDGR